MVRQRHKRVRCDRCGKTIGLRADGSSPVAHKCPHGTQCVGPNWTKGAGGTDCERCKTASDPISHTWSEGDKPLCGGALRRGDSLVSPVTTPSCGSCKAKKVEANLVVPVSEPRENRLLKILKRLADAAETLVGSDPDSPSYKDDEHEFDAALAIARDVWEAESTRTRST